MKCLRVNCCIADSYTQCAEQLSPEDVAMLELGEGLTLLELVDGAKRGADEIMWALRQARL